MAQNLLPLNDVGLKDMPDCQPCDRGLEKTTEHTIFHCSLVRLFWGHVGELTARIHIEQLVSIRFAYVCYNVVASMVWGEMVDVDDAKGGNLTFFTVSLVSPRCALGLQNVSAGLTISFECVRLAMNCKYLLSMDSFNALSDIACVTLIKRFLLIFNAVSHVRFNVLLFHYAYYIILTEYSSHKQEKVSCNRSSPT